MHEKDCNSWTKSHFIEKKNQQNVAVELTKHKTRSSSPNNLCHLKPLCLHNRTMFQDRTIDKTDTFQHVSGGSKGEREGRAPPGPKFLHFHAVFGKNWPNNRLASPPLGLAPPPLGNPGSTTACK